MYEKISELGYLRRVNKGNFEHEEYSVKVVPTEGMTIAQCFNLLKSEVDSAASGVDTIPHKEEVLNGKEETGSKASSKKASLRDTKEKEVVVEPSEDKEDSKIEDSPKETQKASSKKKKSKNSPYDKTNDLHRNILKSFLNSEVSDWKKSPEDAKHASSDLNGVDFLDESGTMLNSFKEKVLEYFK